MNNSEEYLNKLGVKKIIDYFYSKLSMKQNKLISQKNIKTIQGQSVLGHGDIKIKIDGRNIEDYVSEKEYIISQTFNNIDSKINNIDNKIEELSPIELLPTNTLLSFLELSIGGDAEYKYGIMNLGDQQIKYNTMSTQYTFKNNIAIL